MVAGRDVIGVEVVTQHQLSTEMPAGSFSSQPFHMIREWWTFRLDCDDVAFHVHINAARVDSGKIEFNMERIAITPSVHEHHGDRKSTRLNSSHVAISYAVFCLKKKKK